MKWSKSFDRIAVLREDKENTMKDYDRWNCF